VSVEFLVHIEFAFPDAMPDERREELLRAEHRRGRELIDEGLLVRVWRVPGRRANISLYRAEDATAVHAALVSLPLWPYIDARVEPLAAHPLESSP
jgi:muconolactone D-isomerase